MDADHLEDFDCGVESLNVWLKKHGATAAAAGSARAFYEHHGFEPSPTDPLISRWSPSTSVPPWRTRVPDQDAQNGLS
jgi:hypothetical protein